MKFFSSVERNSRYAASFDASLAHLSVRLIVGLGSPSASCSKFHLTLKLEPHTQPNALWFCRCTYAVNAQIISKAKYKWKFSFSAYQESAWEDKDMVLCVRSILTCRIICSNCQVIHLARSAIPLAASLVACFTHCSLQQTQILASRLHWEETTKEFHAGPGCPYRRLKRTFHNSTLKLFEVFKRTQVLNIYTPWSSIGFYLK
jgi:hypothetical protein